MMGKLSGIPAFRVVCLGVFCCSVSGAVPEDDVRRHVLATMKRAATFFRERVASHGGYVYYYSMDLERRWGEGMATRDQIWVQPPGTPSVGMAFLAAYQATGDRFYLEAARAAAEALVYGQLESGGWTNCIDFDPGGRVARYRNGRGRGKNNSSLDDGQTQSAIQFLARVDKALAFEHRTIHESAIFALNALLAAQFPNGAFPQIWTGRVAEKPVIKADYPDYEWRTDNRVKNYWDMYTLNDNVAGNVAGALIEALRVYEEPRCQAALSRLGDFLLLAQMPDPQPAWAQQYDYAMKPIWARAFEPPAIASEESQGVIETLFEIFRVTGDRKYLAPVPKALAYLKRSRLPDGRLARYYELATNRPLYMVRRGKTYTLTHDDSDLPRHYAWKVESRLGEIEKTLQSVRKGVHPAPAGSPAEYSRERIMRITADLDEEGRWISTYRGERLVGQPKFKRGTRYIASAVFCRNMTLLSEYLRTHE